ncbi:SIR2 family protein [Shewanella mangrovisoli]|uniref:SIR2 family protein n=1 Tax=Shewanella mangrovisoli TaxID=2864211 RepID=UPI001C659050|nr:SIR2 family protein [Shewanella mangrovisoli]QYK08855.1 SIR2 family protein [Shewanella mangrovisoli]
MSKLFQDSHFVIERVEQYLSTKLGEYADFNNELNLSATVTVESEGPKVSIHSMNDSSVVYQYDVSDILYWVERDTYFDELEKWNGIKLEEKHYLAVKFLKETEQVPLFLDLIDAIKRQRVAPFVGAGVALAAGYPLWGKALERLAKQIGGEELLAQIKHELSNNHYLEVAELLYQKNEAYFDNFVQTEFRLKAAQEDDRPLFPPVIDLLPTLASSCVITTNFDRLIEKKFDQTKGSSLNGYMYGKQEQNGFISQLLKGERCLMKLHGDAAQPKSYVFTESQYDEAYGINGIDFSKQLPRSLRQIYISHSLLFLGCSLEKDRTLELFESVKQEGHFEIPDHFAFLPLPKPSDVADKKGRLLSLNIKPIWYEVKEHDHSMLEKCLELALDVASKKYSLRSVS